MSSCFFSKKILLGTLSCAVAFALLFNGLAVAQETVLFEEHFDDDGWAARGWYDSPDMVLDAVHRVGDSGGSAAFTWTEAGKTTATSRGARVNFDPVEGFTMSFYIKFSDNWEWTGLGYHPHFIHFITNVDGQFVGPRRTHLTLYVEPVDGELVFGMQDGTNIDMDRLGENLVGITENRAVCGGNGSSDSYGGSHYFGDGNTQNEKEIVSDTLYFTDDQGPRYKGDWHHIKAHIQLNSIIDGKGVANGVMQYWYDGKLIMDYHDIMMRTGQHPQMKINQFLLAPYYGPGVPHAQTIWIDELKIVQDEQELPAVPPPVQSLLLFEEDFDNADWAAKDWYDEPLIDTDAAVKVGDTGSSALFNWSAQGNSSPDARGGRQQFSLVEGITISYDIKFGDNWSFAGDTLFPPSLFVLVTSEDGKWANPVSSHLSLVLNHLDGGVNISMRDMLNIDTQRLGEDLTAETENRAVAGGNGSSDSHQALFFTRDSDGSLFNLKHLRSGPGIVSATEDWHHVQAHVQLNSIIEGKGVANGVARIRLDNKLVLDYHNIVYRTGQYPNMKFNQVILLPYLSGGAPGRQSLWIDNLVIEKEEYALPLPAVLSCDFNGDGNLSVIDVLNMLVAGRANPDDSRLDWNGDGVYGALDVIALLRNIIEGACN